MAVHASPDSSTSACPAPSISTSVRGPRSAPKTRSAWARRVNRSRLPCSRSTGTSTLRAAATASASLTGKCALRSTSRNARWICPSGTNPGSRSRTTASRLENVETATTPSIRGSSAADWIATAVPSDTPATITRSTARKSIARLTSIFS